MAGALALEHGSQCTATWTSVRPGVTRSQAGRNARGGAGAWTRGAGLAASSDPIRVARPPGVHSSAVEWVLAASADGGAWKEGEPAACPLRFARGRPLGVPARSAPLSEEADSPGRRALRRSRVGSTRVVWILDFSCSWPNRGRRLHVMMPAPITLKFATEYPLPISRQTHEIVSPAPGLLLVSQQPDSGLLKIEVDPRSGRPLQVAKHTIHSPFARLHGLCVSKSHPGCVRAWAARTTRKRTESFKLGAVGPDAPLLQIEIPPVYP
jgi:hypothetical protein